MENAGLKKGYLELLDYRDDYKKIYEEEKNNLLAIYKNRIKKIDQVGSTSIIGIKSKPIIDILIQITLKLYIFITYFVVICLEKNQCIFIMLPTSILQSGSWKCFRL